jgi:hypothetical protein
MVLQVELAEAVAEGTAEEVDEGEVVDLHRVMPGTVEPVDEIVRVPGEVDRTAAGLEDEDEVGVRVCVDEEVDETNTEEPVVVGPLGGNRTSSRLGRRVLVVVIAT